MVIGGGSNILVSDEGVHQLVVLNRARTIEFDESSTIPTVRAESGANFGLLARQAANHGLAGLEWAAGIPGTVGGAVFGNAGAHGGDVSNNLISAGILRIKDEPGQVRVQREEWSVEQFQYSYRNSILKRRKLEQPEFSGQRSVVLSAEFRLERSSAEAVKSLMEDYASHRRKTQPPGASIGSMFKNPQDDYAGRLIEACGLKGFQRGDAQISPLHANFFVNLGSARASDVFALITLAHDSVLEKFGIDLELEIELLGSFENQHLVE